MKEIFCSGVGSNYMADLPSVIVRNGKTADLQLKTSSCMVKAPIPIQLFDLIRDDP